MLKHIALLLNNQINKKEIIQSVFGNHFLQDFIDIRTLQGALFSSVTIDKLIEEEFLHDRIIVNSNENTSLSSMSSGQQKKALLNYQINQHPDFILLDDVYSNVDTATQEQIKTQLLELSNTIRFIQIVFRKADILPFIQDVWKVKPDNTVEVCTADALLLNKTDNHFSTAKIPTETISHNHLPDTLVHLRNIYVAYGDKEVLHNLNWEIRKGEFWQLVGPNGSGKSTLVSMICGDNPKAYGQDMTLFGRKKGSGETIWDIKEKIGYFTPAMTLRFT
ncbi:MAG: ATP-binding cassette domain-containing protein, partial [Paludibacter sp.]